MMEILSLITQMAPYLLLGFGLAGVMHAFVPTSLYRRYLGGNSFRSVVNAALLGIPLPLCSCGVIPTAMSLRKEGASKGATVSFLIATPQTGVDSIIATYSLLGLPFALVRPLAALVTSLFGGVLSIVVERNKEEQTAAPQVAENNTLRGKRTLGQKIVEALRYAYVEMMQDIGKTLFVGLVVAGLITVLVPDNFFVLFADNSLLSMLLVLVVAVPMYLCATGSIPIAVALMLKGLTPGAALVLLMAGPAANAASVMVVGKVLGRRTLAVYIVSIVLGAVAFGLGVDYLLPREWFTEPIRAIHAGEHAHMSWFNVACSVVLVGLLVNAMILRYRHKGQDSCSCGHNHGEQASTQGCGCGADEVAHTMEHRFRVEGMHCNKCKANVERVLLGVEGVESVSVELATGDVVVRGTVADVQVLHGAVESIGFEVSPK